MRRLGLAIGILGVTVSAAACGTSGSGTIPSAPAAPLQSAAADHMRLSMMRLRLDDLGPNWRTVRPDRDNESSKCNPRPNVDITAGSWKSHGVSYAYGTTAAIESDAMVFATTADAQKTVDAFMKPSVVACFKREIKSEFHGKSNIKLRGISTGVLHRHKVGDGLTGFRVTLNLGKDGHPFMFFVDFVLVRQDRAVGEFSYMNAFQPASTGTEYTLAEAIAQRGALSR
jgi:hypothetical protein